MPRKCNSPELNVQIRDFLNTNRLKCSLSQCLVPNLLSSAESLFYTKSFFVTWQKVFQHFATCSCQVNAPVAFLIVLEIHVPKSYLICPRKKHMDLYVWLQFPNPVRHLILVLAGLVHFSELNESMKKLQDLLTNNFFFHVFVLQEVKWRLFLLAKMHFLQESAYF